jgi:16S rRNA (cytosine967-C5)-methyltransferase
MNPAARVQTAIELLDAILTSARDNGPSADVILAKGFRERRYAGSKDRRAIRDLVYRVIRAHGQRPASGRAGVLGLSDPDLTAQFGASNYGPQAASDGEAADAPTAVAPWMRDAFVPLIDGAELNALLERAPLDLRANALKTTRDDVLKLYPDAVPIAHTSQGFRLASPVDVEADDAYQSGLIEVQDAGSQLISLAAQAAGAAIVVDLCAGAGGKTLALAADMAGAGRLIACDTDRTRLQQLPKRAERAGAEVELRLLNPAREMEALEDLRAQADIVLVDAPCSGSGTWRRNPELRWRLTPERLARTEALQRQVLDIAAHLVKPGGVIVYAVCSLFEREGAEQIEAFMQRHTGFRAEGILPNTGRLSGAGRLLTPFHDATDGFFVARLARSC